MQLRKEKNARQNRLKLGGQHPRSQFATRSTDEEFFRPHVYHDDRLVGLPVTSACARVFPSMSALKANPFLEEW